MIQDLSGSWCIKGTGESTLVVDSPVPLMHHDPERSWITDPNSDHPKLKECIHSIAALRVADILSVFCTVAPLMRHACLLHSHWFC